MKEEFEQWYFKEPYPKIEKDYSGNYMNPVVTRTYEAFCAGWIARYEADR